jgi:hypothetical protein
MRLEVVLQDIITQFSRAKIWGLSRTPRACSIMEDLVTMFGLAGEMDLEYYHKIYNNEFQ